MATSSDKTYTVGLISVDDEEEVVQFLKENFFKVRTHVY